MNFYKTPGDKVPGSTPIPPSPLLQDLDMHQPVKPQGRQARKKVSNSAFPNPLDYVSLSHPWSPTGNLGSQGPVETTLGNGVLSVPGPLLSQPSSQITPDERGRAPRGTSGCFLSPQIAHRTPSATRGERQFPLENVAVEGG